MTPNEATPVEDFLSRVPRLPERRTRARTLKRRRENGDLIPGWFPAVLAAYALYR